MLAKVLKVLIFTLIGSVCAAAAGAVFGGIEMLSLFLEKGDRIIPPREILKAIEVYFLHYLIMFIIPCIVFGIIITFRKIEVPKWKTAAEYILASFFLALFIHLFIYANDYLEASPLSIKSFFVDLALLIVMLSTWLLVRRGMIGLLKRYPLFRHGLPVIICLILITLTCFSLYASSKEVTQEKASVDRSSPLPNVIFIVVDTLRADHLRCYGYGRRTSPNMDAMTLDGIVFEKCIAQNSWTRPSTTSIMTGLYAGTHACNDLFSTVPEDMVMIPNAMKQFGYRTALISTNIQISQSFGFGLDVDYYAGPKNQAFYHSSLYKALHLSEKFKRQMLQAEAYPKFTFFYNKFFARENNRSRTAKKAEWVRKKFVHWIDEADERPFFAYLHFMEPHTPYDPDPPFDKMFDDPAYSGPILTKPQQKGKVIPPLEEDRPLSSDQLRHLIARYDGEIKSFDHQFRKLIQALKRRGLYDSSLIVLTSDHGEEFYEHGSWTHSHSLYQELIHVPLIIKLPQNQHAGLRISGQCRSVDIVPTLLDLLGLPMWAGIQGESLASIILEEKSDWGGVPAFSETELRRYSLKAYLTDNKKMLFIHLDQPHWFYYDLHSDPGERNSLLEAHEEDAGLIMEQMEAFENAIKDQRFEAQHTDVPNEVERQLQELGYLE